MYSVYFLDSVYIKEHLESKPPLLSSVVHHSVLVADVPKYSGAQVQDESERRWSKFLHAFTDSGPKVFVFVFLIF